MSHLVGASLLIPGEAWVPKQSAATTAVVLHFARPTRGYPEGRIRILCDDGTDTWWDVSKLPAEWITALPEPGTNPVLPMTPSRGRRSAAATPGTGRRRSRSRTSRGGDGYDSSGGAGFSGSEGAGLGAKLLNPIGPTIAAVTTAETAPPTEVELPATGVLGSPTPARQSRGRPRKSLRFAPGTMSPGSTPADPTITPTLSTVGAGVEEPTPLPTSASNTEYITSPLVSPRISDVGAAAPPSASCKAPGYSSIPQRLSWEQRVRNTLLIFLVTLPAIYFHRQLHFGCREDQYMRPLGVVWNGKMSSLTTADFWCAVGYQEPLLAVNLVFLLNVSVLFWFISLLQGSTWLIDPFWTIVPIMIGLFYQHHPTTVSQPLRSRLAMGLLWVWAVRLTHSYFRREEWQVGAREDWRYARMAQRYGRARWAFLSFFAVGIVQQLMLVGITLPLLAIHNAATPWNPVVDTAIFLSAATGIMIALIADNQLRHFMVENEKRAAEGRPRLLLLDTGLWRYSRHPNFFGEQLWWWSLGMWAVLCGQPWMLVGAAFNTLCFIPITLMTEERMLERPERAELYRHYQRTTSVWIPWHKRAAVA